MHFCFSEMTASVILIWMVSESSCWPLRSMFSVREREEVVVGWGVHVHVHMNGQLCAFVA